MQEIIKIIVNNKEWLFSGVGVTFFGVICSFLVRKKGKSNYFNTVQTGGKNSKNVQINYIGRDS